VRTFLLGLLFPLLAFAQSYPSKPVRIIVPFAPGGGSDLAGRLVAAKLTERMGAQFIVENRPGAGSNLGAELAVKSPPDGYTLLLISASYTVNPSVYKLSFDPINDITPIIQISGGPYVVAIHPSVPANNLKEFVDLVKKQPDKYAYGSSGNGSIMHVASEYFLDSAKIKVLHIPYKGTGPAVQDTIGGQVQLVFGAVPVTLPHVKAGRLRALAVTSAKRIAAMPDLPTVAEAGVPDYEFDTWFVVAAPKGTPRSIVDTLNSHTRKVLTVPEQVKFWEERGLTVVASTPEEATAHLASEQKKWGRVIKERGIKAQ